MPTYTPGSRVYARVMMNRALKNGTLIRASKCEICFIETKTAGHHHKGYDEEFALDVQWLCTKCHSEVHCWPEARRVLNEFPELRVGGSRPRKHSDLPHAHRLRGHDQCGQSCLLKQYGL